LSQSDQYRGGGADCRLKARIGFKMICDYETARLDDVNAKEDIERMEDRFLRELICAFAGASPF
jgi:hypothetical protein